MIPGKIAALKQAFQALTHTDLEKQFTAVREAAQAVKEAVEADIELQKKNYHDVLRQLDQLLVQYYCFQKNKGEIITFLDSMERELDSLKISPDIVSGVAKPWSTQERFQKFTGIHQDDAHHTLARVVNAWVLNSGQIIYKELQAEGIGTLTSISFENTNHDYHLKIKDPLYKGFTTYHRHSDDATNKTTVTIQLPKDQVSSLSPKRYQKIAELTVLAELALLRSLHSEKTETKFTELIEKSAVTLKPTDDKNPNHLAYCKALQAAYTKYGFQVSGQSLLKSTASSMPPAAPTTATRLSPAETSPLIFSTTVTNTKSH